MKVGINGAVRDISDLKVGVSGAVRAVPEAYIGVSGAVKKVWPLLPIGTQWTYTSNTTFTVPATGEYQIELHGGGGGGGAGGHVYHVAGRPQYNGGRGGNGGGSGGITTLELTAGEQVAITIGKGGAGGEVRLFTSVDAQDGTSSSFGSYFTVAGGGAGEQGQVRVEDGADGESQGNIASGSDGNSNNTTQTYGDGGSGGAGGRIGGASQVSLPKDGHAGEDGACIITFLG